MKNVLGNSGNVERQISGIKLPLKGRSTECKAFILAAEFTTEKENAGVEILLVEARVGHSSKICQKTIFLFQK